MFVSPWCGFKTSFIFCKWHCKNRAEPSITHQGCWGDWHALQRSCQPQVLRGTKGLYVQPCCSSKTGNAISPLLLLADWSFTTPLLALSPQNQSRLCCVLGEATPKDTAWGTLCRALWKESRASHKGKTSPNQNITSVYIKSIQDFKFRCLWIILGPTQMLCKLINSFSLLVK